MTLELYTPDRLDSLALRVLDVCCRLRGMAQAGREQGLADLAVHDKKALEWIAKLETWALKTEAEVELRAIQNRGALRALRVAPQTEK